MVRYKPASGEPFEIRDEVSSSCLCAIEVTWHIALFVVVAVVIWWMLLFSSVLSILAESLCGSFVAHLLRAIRHVPGGGDRSLTRLASLSLTEKWRLSNLFSILLCPPSSSFSRYWYCTTSRFAAQSPSLMERIHHTRSHATRVSHVDNTVNGDWDAQQF